MGLIYSILLPDINVVSMLLSFLFCVFIPSITWYMADKFAPSLFMTYLLFCIFVTVYTGILLYIKSIIKKKEDSNKKPEDQSGCELTSKGVLLSTLPWYIYSAVVIGAAIFMKYFVRFPPPPPMLILSFVMKIIESPIGWLICGLILYWPALKLSTKCY